MRRRLSGLTTSVAAFGLLGSLVTGCGSSDSDATTLRLVAPEYGAGPATTSKAYWDKLTTAFTAAHPGFKVEVTIHPWADIDRQVTRMVQDGNAPDVALMGAYSDFAAQGRLYAASEVMSVSTEANFLPPLAEAGSFDGDLYGLPFVASSRLLFYNEELFDEAGAKPPKTWSELKDAAQALKREGVLYPYALPLGPEEAHAEALIWELSNGGGYTDDNSGGYSIASEQNARTFRWIKDNLVVPALTGPVPPAELNRQDAFDAFLRGDVGMVNGYPSLLHEATAKGMKVGTLRMPVSDTLDVRETPPAAGVADWMMAFKHDGNRELVGSFLNFVYQDKNISEFAGRYHLLPSTVSATETSQYATDPSAEQFLSALRTARLYPVDDPSWLQVSDTIKRNIGKAVAPSADPKAVLEHIAQQARDATQQR
ncbi:extracellular solute-binding protein [Streptomyces sp. NPDC056169]|uniref:extracellular solute-binding protein n=1 Tax=Streptomyces sp. NPDC056169 TaxID=3345734 RepID=UPI0035DFB8CF